MYFIRSQAKMLSKICMIVKILFVFVFPIITATKIFQVDEVRTATREEKKKLAMAMRAKQLKSIGLKTNDKGI